MRKYKIALLLFVTIVAVISFVFLGFNFKGLDTYSLVLSLFGASAAILGFTMSSENYLKGDTKDEKEKNTNGNQTETEKQKVNNVTEAHDAIIHPIEQVEDPTLMPQKVITPKGYDYDDFIALRRRDVITHFRKTETRLKTEIDTLKRRANTNMIIGAIIAFVGVLGLVAFIVAEQDKSPSEISMLIIHWVTRLSLVTFVEIFAFFFLKMYKTELLSIQYYQDELTSIESRKIALLFSIIHDNKDDISKTIDCLVNIDRNFKLESSQTTVDLEKLKTENNFIKSQIESMMEIFRGALTFKLKDES